MITFPRPSLDEMLKAAAAGTASQLNLMGEAARQGLCAEDGSDKTASAAPTEDVQSVPTEYVEKLAEACRSISEEMTKSASQGPGQGPNALPVSASGSPKQEIRVGNSGHAESAAPGSPSAKRPGATSDAGTALQTNYHAAHDGQHMPQGRPGMASPVNKLAEANLELLRKAAAAAPALGAPQQAALNAAEEQTTQAGRPVLVPTVAGMAVGGTMGAAGGAALGSKLLGRQYGSIPGAAIGGIGGAVLGGAGGAAMGNAIGRAYRTPAQAAAFNNALQQEQALIEQQFGAGAQGAAQSDPSKVALASANLAYLHKVAENPVLPSGVSATGQGKPPVSAQASSQEHLINSAAGIVGATRRETKRDPKAEVGRVLEHAALTPSTDPVLGQALEHTESSGAKIAASQLQTASARELVNRLLASAGSAVGG